MTGHRGRVGCLSWSSHLLSTGSRDRTILHRDVRAPEDYTARLAAHRSEVGSGFRRAQRPRKGGTALACADIRIIHGAGLEAH